MRTRIAALEKDDCQNHRIESKAGKKEISQKTRTWMELFCLHGSLVSHMYLIYVEAHFGPCFIAGIVLVLCM